VAETMRAMGATCDGVEMTETLKPTPRPGEVRVKVIASAVNAAGGGIGSVAVGSVGSW
jgi:NADPH:quinone reductase-like Zn-dependent oxidoreductase